MVVNQMMNENMNERQDQIWWIENICDSETDEVKGIVRQFFSIVQISYLGKKWGVVKLILAGGVYKRPKLKRFGF